MCRMKLIIALLILVFLYIILCCVSPNPSNGSGGLSPNGGMRNLPFEHSPLKYPQIQYPTYETDQYDRHEIPRPMTWKVGHWSM
jgi:hypothetical protein